MHENLENCPSLKYFMRTISQDQLQSNVEKLSSAGADLKGFYRRFGWGVIGTRLLDSNGTEEETQNYLILEELRAVSEVFPDMRHSRNHLVFGHDMAGFYGLICVETGLIQELNIALMTPEETGLKFSSFLHHRIAFDRVNYEDFIENDNMSLKPV